MRRPGRVVVVLLLLLHVRAAWAAPHAGPAGWHALGRWHAEHAAPTQDWVGWAPAQHWVVRAKARAEWGTPYAAGLQTSRWRHGRRPHGVVRLQGGRAKRKHQASLWYVIYELASP